MPELPEVEALALDLRGRLDGHAIAKIHLAAFSALKTFDPPLSALEGTMVDDVTRHGKFLDIEASGMHLVLHLARAGWVRWRDEVPTIPPKPSTKSTLALRVVLDDQSGPRHHRGRHPQEPGGVRRPRPAGRPGHRPPRPGPAHRRLHHRAASRDPRARGPQAAQGRAPLPEHHRRHRQRLLRRDPARREDVAVQAGQQPHRRRAPDAVRRPARPPSATPSTAPAACTPASSRARRSPTSPCTAAPARRARSAATPCARCPSPTPACSTAPPARPAASRWPTDG